jgi:hypothetical protein
MEGLEKVLSRNNNLLDEPQSKLSWASGYYGWSAGGWGELVTDLGDGKYKVCINKLYVNIREEGLGDYVKDRFSKFCEKEGFNIKVIQAKFSNMNPDRAQCEITFVDKGHMPNVILKEEFNNEKSLLFKDGIIEVEGTVYTEGMGDNEVFCLDLNKDQTKELFNTMKKYYALQ